VDVISACSHGDVASLRCLVSSFGIDAILKAKDGGSTGLHSAAFNEQLSVVEILLEYGAEIDEEGKSPFHCGLK
jgi:ankyrin repeat protein